MGENQIGQAALRNPHLKAMIPQSAGGQVGSAGGRYRYAAIVNGGAFELSTAFGWFRGSGTKYFFRPPPELAQDEVRQIEEFFNTAPEIPGINFREIWKTFPVQACIYQ